MIDKNSTAVVLDVFFDSPTREFHARELSRKTGLSIFSVLEALKKLSKEGLISVQKKGNMKIVAASHSIEFLHTKRISNLEKIYESKIVEYLSGAYGNPEAIILFGSYSRGDDVESSDIDIAIITREHKEHNLEKFEKAVSRKISLHEIDLKKVSREFHNNLINGIVLEGAMAWFAINQIVLAMILAAFAGEFLYIGATNLLPETYKFAERRMSWRMTIAMTSGVLLIFVLSSIL